jgi:CBS domain-containing membrane protein
VVTCARFDLFHIHFYGVQRMSFQNWLVSFKPGFDPVPFSEKLRSGIAAFTGILLLGLALRLLPGEAGFHLAIFASMAAAAVLLYAAPHSPMAQPWPLVCGNLVSGLIGWILSLLIPDPVLAAACAVGTAVFIMYLMNCLHPPGGATAMIMVLGAEQFHQHGWLWAALTVTANTLLSLILALTINSLLPGRHYPARHAVKPATRKGELDAADIEWALSRMDGVIDVNEEDLLEIYQLAAEHVRSRT